MTATQTMFGLTVPNGGKRSMARAVTVALGLAALLAALCVAYFALDAGADYPEPLAQVSD